MERSEAEKLLYDWADILEVDTSKNSFKDVVEELALAVQKERLTFDEATEQFKYQLLKPIEKQDGSGSISVIDIRETSLNDNKSIQRFKENESVDQAMMLISKSCGIELGFASRLKQRDVSKINAVVLGFFVQAAPSRG